MAIAVSVLLFALLMGAISYYGYRSYVRPGRVYDQVGAQVLATEFDGQKKDAPPEIVRFLQFIGEQVPIDPRDASVQRRMLIAAGHRSDWAVPAYVGARIVLCITMLIAAVIVRPLLIDGGVLMIVFLVSGAALGYFIPSFWLDSAISARQERLRFALPDALDLLVVAVEAGLGIDQAMALVAAELKDAHADICEEFNLVSLETRAGTARADALKNLGRRTGERGVRQLAAIMIQSDRFGTSMADALRTHSDFLRVRRRQEAEERANKVGVKLVFPIFFFILPSMIVISAGAGILQLVKFLFPLMQNFNVGL